ncbi:hypothetical protein [Rehaibacterium terrae]|uniref:Uncharacterized protein n=1 Tax=Rehaibacterium terrae TaxID=1341696 RepID=A0A7W7XZP3_9GAMM|nr:hypothetical protein [Rehaibacterium terrae]MBB5015410.1 hypothetical protein [Rehaibacterium terrae]
MLFGEHRAPLGALQKPGLSRQSVRQPHALGGAGAAAGEQLSWLSLAVDQVRKWKAARFDRAAFATESDYFGIVCVL